MVCVFECFRSTSFLFQDAILKKKPQTDALLARTNEKKLSTWLSNALTIQIEHDTNLKMKNCKAKNRLDLFVLFFQQTVIIHLRSSGVFKIALKINLPSFFGILDSKVYSLKLILISYSCSRECKSHLSMLIHFLFRGETLQPQLVRLISNSVAHRELWWQQRFLK